MKRKLSFQLTVLESSQCKNLSDLLRNFSWLDSLIWSGKISQMCLNVGGKRHWVMSKNFVHFPGTRLGRLARAKTTKQILDQCDKYFPGDIPEFFFDHNWMGFNSILDVYRIGTLHLMSGKGFKSAFAFLWLLSIFK